MKQFYHRYSAIPYLVFAGLLFACAARPDRGAPNPSGQTYREAILLMCDSDAQLAAGEDLGHSSVEGEAALTDFWLEHVTNPDAIYFLTIFRTKSPGEQSVMLSEQARAEAITSCSLAKRLEQRAP